MYESGISRKRWMFAREATLTEATQLKQAILMGVNDKKLVQELIGIIPTHSLDQVVQHCCAYEAARPKASAVTSPSTAAHAVSSYMKGKKVKQRNSSSSSTTSQPPNTSSCDCCGHSHAKGQCKAADNICSNCGRKGHRVKTPRCPALSATCRRCGKRGHFDQYCRSTKP